MWPTPGHVCDTDVCMALDSEVFHVWCSFEAPAVHLISCDGPMWGEALVPRGRKEAPLIFPCVMHGMGRFSRTVMLTHWPYWWSVYRQLALHARHTAAQSTLCYIYTNPYVYTSLENSSPLPLVKGMVELVRWKNSIFRSLWFPILWTCRRPHRIDKFNQNLLLNI